MQELSVSFAERTSALCAASTAGEPEVPLLAAATDAEAAGASLMWLRLLTSAYMRANAETFEPVCATEARSFGDYLAKEVETPGVEAEEMQVRALTEALQVRTRIEYLNGAGMAWSDRCGVHGFVTCGPEAAAGAGGGAPAMLVACLLYRPGHYDVLVPRSWEQLSRAEAAEQNPSLVPPLPPKKRAPRAPPDPPTPHSRHRTPDTT